MKFDALIEEIQKNQWEVFDVELFENGEIVQEWHAGEIKRHPVYSATKTITSLAAGMAWDEGKLNLHQSVYEYLKAEMPEDINPKQREDLRQITVERLLTMSVDGYPFRPEGKHWLENALKTQLPCAEKRVFSYSNVSAYLVGVIVEKAVGESLYDYLERKLFLPLGIAKPAYQTCPDGYFYGATGMSLSVRELRRIGQLLMQNGNYEGRQLISSKYIQLATGIRQENSQDGYGYFIWKYKDGYSINGKWGQRCIIFPKENRIITCLSHMEHGSGNMLAVLEEKIK